MEIQQREMQAQAQVWNHIYRFVETVALHSAVELRIVDIMNKNGDRINLSGLAASLPIPSVNKDRLHQIMRFLVHMQLLSVETVAEKRKNVDEEEGEEWYVLTPAAKLLVSDNKESLLPSMAALRVFLEGGTSLSSCLEGKTPDPKKYKQLYDGMICRTRILTKAMIRGCVGVFTGIQSLVDVGGGSGIAMAEISKAFPHIKCTFFDLPHVIKDEVLHPGVDQIHGNMFEFIPPADAILLKNVLHDWKDEECVKILKRCKEAIVKKGGKVIIADIVVDLDVEPWFKNTRHAIDIATMMSVGGKERTEQEFKNLLDAAGFGGYEIIPLQALQSVIVAYL